MIIPFLKKKKKKLKGGYICNCTIWKSYQMRYVSSTTVQFLYINFMLCMPLLKLKKLKNKKLRYESRVMEIYLIFFNILDAIYSNYKKFKVERKKKKRHGQSRSID